MSDAELAWLDGIDQAALVNSRRVTSAELVEFAIERVERLNPTLNFLVSPIYEQARAAASHPSGQGPLAGVPMLLKDHVATCAGIPHTEGSAFLRNYVASHDSELVTRFRRGGLVPIGTTSTCEFALLSTVEPALYGPCRNPWSLDRTTGGSSGGSTAAVAAGCVPIAHGNDAGGSLRIPASCCGVFGLKPTRARNPLGPEYGDLYGGLWAEHVVTRSVRDSAAALDATAGTMGGDPYAAPPPSGPFLDAIGADPGSLRIAVMEEAPTGVEVHPDCRAAVRDAARLCEALGHSVEEASLPIDGQRMEEAFFVMYSAGTAWRIDAWGRALGRPPELDELEPFTRALAELGRRYTAPDYLMATQDLQAGARRISRFHDRFDICLTPTLAAPPVRLGHFDAPPDDPLQVLHTDAAFAAFTWIANTTGQPAMSVPLYWTGEELPIGTHFTAAVGQEVLLLRLASQLEQARPWRHRRPALTCA